MPVQVGDADAQGQGDGDGTVVGVLGAEGDAISFACDEYAIGLPDIEAFIEQKIPVGQFEPSMLLPLPRGMAGT